MNWNKITAFVAFAVLVLVGINTALAIREQTRKNKAQPDA